MEKDDVTASGLRGASLAAAGKKRKPSEHTFAQGYTLHSECTCCEHAADRLAGMEDMLRGAMRLIEAGFEGEAAFEIDRVLCCLNDLIEQGKDHPGQFEEDDKTPF